MAGSSRKRRRSYNNALREELAEQTRERVLDAVARLLWEGKLEDFSIARVSERSGVSAATVYRHFPNRTALLDAVDEWLGRKVARPPTPRSLEELADGAPELFRYYATHRDRLRMARAASALRELRAHAQRRRDRAIAGALAPLTEHLPPERANAIHALFRTFYGFDTFEMMTERFGVSVELASEIVAWAVRALAADLEREAAEETRRKSPRREERA